MLLMPGERPQTMAHDSWVATDWPRCEYQPQETMEIAMVTYWFTLFVDGLDGNTVVILLKIGASRNNGNRHFDILVFPFCGWIGWKYSSNSIEKLWPTTCS